jgi:hypothetical protein
MIFKYYRRDDEYVYSDGKKFGRFEVYFVGKSEPIQRDTVEDITEILYEDANFDNILDIKIVTMHGASGGDYTEYYFYNSKSKKFEYGIGFLSEPSVNKVDSTISTSSQCCGGRSGSREVLKFINGEFIPIEESDYSEHESNKKQLLGDSLVLIDRSTTTNVEENILIDSSWTYLYGKLRLVNVSKRKVLDHPPTTAQNHAAIGYQDVMGSFLFETEIIFDYRLNAKGKVEAMSKTREVQDGEWKEVRKTGYHVISP